VQETRNAEAQKIRRSEDQKIRSAPVAELAGRSMTVMMESKGIEIVISNSGGTGGSDGLIGCSGMQ
jgi:hypothetical protein